MRIYHWAKSQVNKRIVSTNNSDNLSMNHNHASQSTLEPSINGWPVDYAPALKIISPNFQSGRSKPISCLVLHGTAGGGTIEWFQNPASKVSAHYVIGQDGLVVQMVREADTAWHAGVVSPGSVLAGKGNPNSFCIGIEFSRNKANDNPMPDAQITAGLNLVKNIRARYPDIATYFHDEISIGRVCPGPGFPKGTFRP